MNNKVRALIILLGGLLGVTLLGMLLLFLIAVGGAYVVAAILILPFLTMMYNFILDDLNDSDRGKKRSKTK